MIQQAEDYIEIPEPSRIVSVIGCDTYYGSHMMKYLLGSGKMVFGFRQDEVFDFKHIPDIAIGQENISYEPAPLFSDYLVICLNPAIGARTFSEKIQQICKQCLKESYMGKIGFFSEGTICLSHAEAIQEDRPVTPRTEHDLALAVAENQLNVMLYNSANYSMPVIIRSGVPYGNETNSKEPVGFVNNMLEERKKKSVLRIPLISVQKRSVSHIADICNAAIKVLDSVMEPLTINIPGEIYSVQEVTDLITANFGGEVRKQGMPANDDPDFYPGDLYLSDTLFRQTIVFKPQYTFNKWLKEYDSVC